MIELMCNMFYLNIIDYSYVINLENEYSLISQSHHIVVCYSPSLSVLLLLGDGGGDVCPQILV